MIKPDPKSPESSTAAPATPPVASRNTRDRFIDFLCDIEDGRFLENCAGELQVLVREMTQLHRNGLTKTAGAITLVISVKNEGGVFDVIGEQKVKMPKRPRTRSIMYAGRDGSLSSVNPHQMEMPLKDVTAPSGLRSI